MRQLLRFEHWMIQKFKFDRMSNNLLWVAVIVLPVIFGLIVWLLRLHEQPDVRFIVSRDPALSGKVAEIYYREDAFYFRPPLIRPIATFFFPCRNEIPAWLEFFSPLENTKPSEVDVSMVQGELQNIQAPFKMGILNGRKK